MKKTILKSVIVGCVFILTILVVSNIMNKGNADMTMDMGAATYPVISVRYGGMSINELHGYAKSMEVSQMRECVTPLASGRKVSIEADTYGSVVREIAYEVRSLDGERLIESTQLPSFEKDGNEITAEFALKDLIESNQEYMLVILLTMGNGREIRYYSRIIYPEEYYVIDKLEYVYDFSNKTFNREAAKELTKYLESNSEGDNTTYGRVDIHSSFNQVTWGDLKVTRETQPAITIKELAAQTGNFVLQYYVSIPESGEKNYYRVKEYYRIRYTEERIYLLDFERTMDQMFDESGSVYANNKIVLGITSETIPLMESDGGSTLAFVVGDRLYSYNVVDNKMALLFGFYNKENADARTLYDSHEIKILNVDEGGNVTFLVYGYMNRGRHEGESGISAYYYDSTVNTVEELIYIPTFQSQALLMEEVEQLSYINKSGILYLKWRNQILGIDTIQRTNRVVVQELAENGYKVSDSNKMIVWQKDGDAYQGKELILKNLTTGAQKSIQAGEGEVIAPIGFMNEDLIYGVARESDIITDYAGNTVFPMYRIRIENENEGVLMTYQQDHVYVTEGIVSGNQIILSRVEKEEDGSYLEIEDDHIMNAKIESKTINVIETVITERYEKLTQIALKNQIDTASMKLLTPKEVLFEGGRSISFETSAQQSERFFVYGKEGMEGIFTNEGRAVDLADSIAGAVINERGAYVWMKGNRSLSNQIMAIQGELAPEGGNTLAVCLDTMLEYEGMVRNSEYMLSKGENVISILEEGLESAQILDLTGCSLDAVLYYVNQDIPVLVMLEDGNAVLLVGFNEKNTVVMNPETGMTGKVGMNDSKEWFEQNGNRFITYVRSEK